MTPKNNKITTPASPPTFYPPGLPARPHLNYSLNKRIFRDK